MDLGDAAEDQLTMWATEAGINVVEPKRDRRGWDRILEFPRESSHNDPVFFDRRPPELVVQLQAKGKRKGGRRRVSVKLDNWERLAKSPLPSFFSVIEYGADDKPATAYLVHVDEKLVRTVLKRLREEAASRAQTKAQPAPTRRKRKRKALPIHKMTLDLTWSDADRLPEPTGIALSKRIRETVGDMQEYITRKVRWHQSLGYDESRIHVSFSLEGRLLEQFEALANFAVGLRDELVVRQVEQHDMRFGVALPIPNPGSATSARLSNLQAPSVGESTVTVRTTSGTREVRFACSTYASMAVFPFLPPPFWKIRCVTQFASFTIQPLILKARCDFNMNDLNRALPLDDLARGARLALLFGRSEGETVEMHFEVAIWGRRSELSTVGKAAPQTNLTVEFLELADDLRRAWEISRTFEVPEGVTANALDLHEESDLINYLHAIVTARPIRATFPVPAPPKVGERAMAIQWTAIQLEEVILLAIFGVDKEWAVEQDGQLTITGPARIISKHVIKRTKWLAWTRSNLDRSMESACTLAERSGVDLVVRIRTPEVEGEA